MQMTCDFGPCAAVKHPYVSVEVGHCTDIVSKSSTVERTVRAARAIIDSHVTDT
jgi:hypothetical protein